MFFIKETMKSIKGDMQLFKELVCHWPLFGANFMKRDSIYPVMRVEKYSYAPDRIKYCLFLESIFGKRIRWILWNLSTYQYFVAKTESLLVCPKEGHFDFVSTCGEMRPHFRRIDPFID